jgi:hypothetical protein
VSTVAKGAMVANALRPLITQPPPRRVAVVVGRVRSWGDGSLMAAANTTSSETTRRSLAARAASLRSSQRARATRWERTRFTSPERCMLTPIAVAASPPASREAATSRS